MISVLDIGVGNQGSVVNIIEDIGYSCCIINKPEEILNASMLILPGVGHVDSFMNAVDPFREALNHHVLENKKPLLGICLGAHVLGKKSEEGSSECFGWLNFNVEEFDKKVVKTSPNMGWIVHDSGERYYYAHSFYVPFKYEMNFDECDIRDYNGVKFITMFRKNNIFGTQFHPEKSGKSGKKLIKHIILSLNV